MVNKYDRLSNDAVLNTVKFPWGWRMIFSGGRYLPVALSFEEWWKRQITNREGNVFFV